MKNKTMINTIQQRVFFYKGAFVLYFKTLLMSTFLLCYTEVAHAQDPHFSQFYYTPLNINPANTGVFNGDIRVSSSYRMQWFTVTSPFKTTSISVDAPVFRSSMRRNDFWAAGLNIVNDNQGTAGLTTNLYNVLGSYTKYLGGKKSTYLSFGYELGYGMKSAGLGTLKFDSQYDPATGGYSSTMGVNEQYSSVAQFIDMSAGVALNFHTDNKSRNSLGLAIQHVTSPNVSILGRTDPLLRKISVNWSAAYNVGTNTNAVFMPSLLFVKQGNSLLINGGASMKYLLQERSRYTNYHNERSMAIGLFYRYRDAAYINLRFDFEDFAFAVAYDINISGLTATSKAIGAFEGMLQYRGVFGHQKMSKRSSTQFL